MKSQTIAVSVVLLLMAVATLPGLSFSLNSSVTSYNNGITINGGITITKGSSEFHATNVDELFKNENITNFDSAYEIASGNDSFCSKPGLEEVTLTIPSGKSFKICIKFDGYNITWNNSKFNLDIYYAGNKNPDISATNLDGVQLLINHSTRTGYLSNSSGKWQLIPDFNPAATITSSSGNVTVDIKGFENSSVKIHFYIIFV